MTAVDWDALRLTSLADILDGLSLVAAHPVVRRGERAWHLTEGLVALRISDAQAEEPRAVQHAVAAWEAMRTAAMTQEVVS